MTAVLALAFVLQPDKDITGRYECTSHEKEKQHKGTVEVYKVKHDGKDLGFYLVRWKLNSWSYEGVGVLRGDTLSVSWQYTEKGNQETKDFLGLHVMRFTAEGAEGVWLMVPGTGVQKEVWKKAKPAVDA